MLSGLYQSERVCAILPTPRAASNLRTESFEVPIGKSRRIAVRVVTVSTGDEDGIANTVRTRDSVLAAHPEAQASSVAARIERMRADRLGSPSCGNDYRSSRRTNLPARTVLRANAIAKLQRIQIVCAR